MTWLITSVSKTIVGRKRPDFLDRCIPNYSLLPNTTTFFDSRVCTGSLSNIKYGSTSFPSGHSSLSWSSTVFVFLYLFEVSDVISSLSISLIQAGLISVSLFMALSRVRDNVHHLSDILAGGIFGSVTSAFFYYYYQTLDRKKEKKESQGDEDDEIDINDHVMEINKNEYENKFIAE